MDPSEYRAIYTVEDRHWWYAGMGRISRALLETAYPDRRDLRILDAGCGTGGALGFLAQFGTVTGSDISPLALAYSRARGHAALSQASVTALPYAAASFDLVTSFDVLYHRAVGDPCVALGEFRRVLRPGGRVLLRLPAYDRLRGRHDAVVHTARRFTTSALAESLRETGFAIERLSYANTLLFPLAAAKRLLERRAPAHAPAHSDVTPNPAWLDAVLSRPLAIEAAWLRRRDLPFGLSVVALARGRA